MRGLLVPLVLAVSACATAPPTLPPPEESAAAAPPAAEDPLAFARRTPGGPLMTVEEIVATLGPADVDRRDGAGAMLTYRLERCALLLLFVKDERGALRLSEARAGPRAAEEAPPALSACVADARARRGLAS